MPLPARPVAVVTLLLLASTVVWRRGDIFSGSLDPVVVGKALLSLIALALAFYHADRQRPARSLGTASLWFTAVLLAASVFGALTHGTLLSSGIETARVVIVALTVFFLLRMAPRLEVLSGLVWSSGAIALVAAVTGVGTLGSGRLDGGIPPLNPNELALLCSIVVLAMVWRVVLGEARWYTWATAAAYLGILWLTGSRTALIMLLPAVLVMALHLRRPSPGLVVAVLGLGVLLTGAVATGTVDGFLQRHGTGTSTLDSRFIAWDAARTWARTSWQVFFGGGLSVKKIPVSGQWWDTQLLDSSWVSAVIQAGIVGLVVAAGWVLWVLFGVLRTPRHQRILFLGLVVFLVGRSVLESGLFDATPAFLLLLTVSVLAEAGSRIPAPPPPPLPPPPPPPAPTPATEPRWSTGAPARVPLADPVT